MSRFFSDKRGGIGRMITTFFAMILVVVILIGFVLVHSILNTIAERPVGQISFDEADSSFFEYVNGSYLDLAEVKFMVSNGEEVDKALEVFDER